jgi:WD40 repeat protein
MSVGPRVVVFAGLLVVGTASAAEPPGPPPKVWLPEGAVARLGSTRLRHADLPLWLTFSLDSKSLVSGGSDGAVRVWDVTTGEQTAFKHTPSRHVTMVRFAPDGRRLGSLTDEGRVRLLDPVTLEERTVIDTRDVIEFDVSTDGRFIGTVSAGGGLTVTEIKTGLPHLELPVGYGARFHPDGKLIATFDPAGVVTVYQITGGKPVFTAKHGGPLQGLAFRPDGGVFATGGAGPNGKVKLWEIGNQDPIAELADATGRVAFIGKDRLAAARRVGYGVYDLRKKGWSRIIPDAAGVVAISPDGTKLAATGNGSVRVRMWDLTTGEQLHAADDAVPDPKLLHPTADGRHLFVVAADRGFVWRIGETAPTPAVKFPGRVTAAAAGGDHLAVATAKGVSIWDHIDPSRPLAAEPSRTIEGADHVTAIALSSDGKRLAYARGNGQVWLADPATGQALRAVQEKTTTVGLAFTPRGDRLAILGSGYVRLWSLGTGDAADNLVWDQRVSRGPQGALAFSPDGKAVAASASPRMLVLSAADKQQLFTCDRQGAGGIYHAAAFTPDGRFLVTGSSGQDGCVEVWDVKTGERVRRYSTGLGSVNRLAVLPDGKRVASAGADDAVTVWDLTAPAAMPEGRDKE